MLLADLRNVYKFLPGAEPSVGRAGAPGLSAGAQCGVGFLRLPHSLWRAERLFCVQRGARALPVHWLLVTPRVHRPAATQALWPQCRDGGSQPHAPLWRLQRAGVLPVLDAFGMVMS
jgi:hypothetical protein